MKKTKRVQIDSIDEFEDLTLFANESFDTGDVDLFEFTSEESSALTRLKSTILSLDWEITDEILQELADEVANLESVYAGDKVAEVYLQGLDKIGSYIRSKGAYAHPNSIKLLLTFFYDFEKAVSSPNISGEEITRILKADIRKFKILQYQIALGEKDQTKEPVLEISAAVPAPEDSGGDHRKLLKAAILSLDWEVTEESLAQYTASLVGFRAQVADNRLALVLVQGLQVLGEYIGEQRAGAHPEAFALLHSFAEALEQVADRAESGLDDAQARKIITAQINRLDHLKLLIAAPGQVPIDEARIDEVVGEISTPAAAADIASEPFAGLDEATTDHGAALTEAFPIELDTDHGADEQAGLDLATELDSLFAETSKPAMESADVQYPDEVLPPEAIHPLDDELADGHIEASLHDRRGLAPALSGAEESERTSPERDLPAEDDLAEQLDVFFAKTEGESDDSPADTVLDLDFSADTGPTAALADAEEPADHIDLGLETTPAGLDLEASLDSFFTEPAAGSAAAPAEYEPLSLDLEPAGEEEPPPVGPTADLGQFDLEADLPPENFDLEGTLDNLFAEPVTDDEGAEALPEIGADASADTRPAASEPEIALSEVDEPNFVDALGLEEMTEEPGLEDIESRLDSFFADPGNEPEQPAAASPSVEEIEQSLFFADEHGLPAALADAEEERGFSEEEEKAGLAFSPLADIDEKLDLFFGEAEQAAAEPTDGETADEARAVEETPLATLLADLPVDPAGADETLGLDSAGGESAEPDLEPQFDFFGEASDDDEEELHTAAEDDLTRALEATIAAEQPTAPAAGLGLATAVAPSAAEREPVLTSLGALLPGVVRSPTREQVHAALEQTAILRDLTDDAGQRALVQLVGAVVTLLGRTAGQDNTDTGALVNYLYTALLHGDGGPATLATAVSRYASWQEGVCARMPLIPARREGDAGEPQLEYTARDLYFELSELRAGFRDELAQLRHEMQHLQQHRH